MTPVPQAGDLQRPCVPVVRVVLVRSVYSCLSTATGSTFVALHAGM
jgi:hypothetical protein